jgi:hypothetical protein
MEWIHDSRIDCHSGMLTLKVSRYLELVKEVHEQRGGILGQRDVLKTTTAKRIRDRMIDDITAGAVLPPVVIGVVAPDKLAELVKLDADQFADAIANQELSIIDGMQRTAALMEAGRSDPAVFTRDVRIEFWLAKSVRALVYRMLVLNTGQIPWTLGRQLSVVYLPLLEEIKKNVKGIERIFTPDQPGRRVGGGQFSSDSLVELYLAFSLRKPNIDPRESLSEEFSRLDFADTLTDESFQNYFYEALSLLVRLDLSFDRYDGRAAGRFSRGKDVFGSQPARIGFMVAVSQNVLGRPGLDRNPAERPTRLNAIKNGATTLETKLQAMSSKEVGEFLKLDVLSEILDKKVGQVGRYERGVFNEAFKVLIDEQFNVPNMEPCWRAS